MAHKTIRQREAAIDDRLNGLGICSLDLGGDSPPPPDPAIGQAAQMNAEVGREYLAWYKSKDAAEAPMRQEAGNVALDMANRQIATSKKQEGYADDTRAYELSTFRPLEQKIAADALGYDTPARREAESAQAMADVGTAGEAGRANLIREVQSRGGDVNSGNFTAGLAGMTGREAAVKAASGNQARKNVEAIAGAKLADAANLGRGIASTNATQTQLGLQAGNSGVANAQIPGQASNQQTAAYGGAAGTAIQGNSSAGNLMLGQYNAQNGATGNSDAAMGAVGSVVGAALPLIFSDKNLKKDRKKISGKASLDMVKRLPSNESWRYKKGSVADDGGKVHRGRMAQDVNRVMGDDAAPGGKMINLERMAAEGLSAIKEVAKGQKKVENRVLRLEDARRKKRA